MTTLHPMPIHSTKEFDWDKKTSTFTAEASELRWPIGWPTLGQVYDDACDEGFTLVSAKTGKEVPVAIEKVDEDNDFSGGWSKIAFVPANRADRDKFRVVVFND